MRLAICLFLFALSPANAAVAAINYTSGHATGSNPATTTAMNTTGATLYVVSVANASAVNGCSSVTVADSQTNTWHSTTSRASTTITNCIWYSYDKSGGALATNASHTFSCSSGSFCTIVAAAYSGTLTGADPLDQQNGTFSNSASSLATGSITPSQNCELVISGAGLRSSTTYTASNLTTHALVDWVTANTSGGGVADVVQTTATAISSTWGMAGTGQLAVSIVSFKAASTSCSSSVVRRRLIQ